MKTAWESYLDQQLADPTVRQAFKEETKVLGMSLDIRLVAKKVEALDPSIHRRSCGQSGKRF